MDEEKKKFSDLQNIDRRIIELRQKHAESPEKKRQYSSSSLVIELAAGVLVGTFLGIYLDKWLGTSPIFLILCMLFGVAAGGLNIYKLAPKSQKHSSVKEDNKNQDS